jgi:hypothetical protein
MATSQQASSGTSSISVDASTQNAGVATSSSAGSRPRPARRRAMPRKASAAITGKGNSAACITVSRSPKSAIHGASQ